MSLWLSNKQLHHPLLVPVLLIAVILAVYYPAMLSGIHTIDDPGIISLYSSSPPLSQILLPGNGYYYRPLVELSYWIDNRFWGMEPVVMHLEIILLHCANSFLVFLLARKFSRGDGDGVPLASLFAALLFALHPVNVEAVAWIAGRTDPLLALFVLSACIFWVRWLDNPRWQDLGAALLLFVAALLTKETALAAGAVALLIAFAWPGTATPRQRMTAVCTLAAPGLLLAVFALFFRSGTSGLSRFLSGTELRLGQGTWDGLIALGFYARKLVVPVPLNFAITEVHPVYGLVGLILLTALGWACMRRTMAGILFASAAMLALPAVVVAVQQVAWTPFAERYLYLPSAFFAVGLSVLIRSGGKKIAGSVILVTLCVLVASALISRQRSMLWSNKFAFAQDSVAKSPGFGSLYNELGVLLLGRGEIEKAADAFAAADKLNKRPSMRLPIKANLLGIQFAKGNYLGVRELFFQLFKEKQQAPDDFLELLHRADSIRMNTLSGKDKVLLATDLLETLELLNQKHPDAFWLYRSGQLSFITGDEVKAADFFRRSIAGAPADAHYLIAAGIYLRKLGQAK